MGTVAKFTSRITKADYDAFVAESRANSDRLRSCARHFFGHQQATVGGKITCSNCTGRLSLPEAMSYIDGYVAAGGAPSDIWPRYGEKS